MNCFPRLALDSSRPPLAAVPPPPGEQLARQPRAGRRRDLDRVRHDRWLGDQPGPPPQPLPRSDNLLDNRPALVPAPDGPVLAFYSSDGRLLPRGRAHRRSRNRFYTHSGTPPGVVENDLFVAALARPDDDAPAPEPGAAAVNSRAGPAGPPERVGGHRPDAVVPDQGRRQDVSAPPRRVPPPHRDLRRRRRRRRPGGHVALCASTSPPSTGSATATTTTAAVTSITWWIIQKTTDLYHNPPTFTPMFTYERSVCYPGGHRNVMFTYRGVRTLPRLIGEGRGILTDVNGRDLDAEMLYAYLNELGGICASHTSGTGMGTDWRENDPKVEPFVEIYQGDRDSLRGPRRPPRGARPARRRRRLAAAGHGLERPGDAVQARLRVLQRPHLDPHQLRRRARRGHRPARRSSTPSRTGTATAPPTTSCSTSAAASTSWATSSPPTAP